MRYLYSILLYLLAPFIFIRLLWKTRKYPDSRKRLWERFGYFRQAIQQDGIWIHAVSVGETIATVPLIKQLQKEFPHIPIILSTTTVTGYERAKALYHDTIPHIYMPYDYPGAIRRTLDYLKPRMLVLMETELWPNLLYQCQQKAIPIMLANARLSEKSAKAYQKIASMTYDMLSQIDIICSQNMTDGGRFIVLGAEPEKVVITGSIKFDQQIPPSTHEKAAFFRNLWGSRPVWVAASTHEGEEEIVLRAYEKILKEIPDLLLILVPRHPERFGKVATLCRKQGYETLMRSENTPCQASTKIVVGDSMGELAAFYAASNLAYVGGSLVPTGGHNLLEPAAVGIPAITGPHVFNFTDITALLMDAGNVKMVNDENELAQAVIDWLNNPSARIKAGELGQQTVEQNRGAVTAHVAQVTTLLKNSSRGI